MTHDPASTSVEIMETKTISIDTFRVVVRHDTGSDHEIIGGGMGHAEAIKVSKGVGINLDREIWYVSVESEADTATIVARLNSYTGGDLWRDVIWPLGVDIEAQHKADPDCQFDVFVLEDGRTFRYDRSAGDAKNGVLYATHGTWRID